MAEERRAIEIPLWLKIDRTHDGIAVGYSDVVVYVTNTFKKFKMNYKGTFGKSKMFSSEDEADKYIKREKEISNLKSFVDNISKSIKGI